MSKQIRKVLKPCSLLQQEVSIEVECEHISSLGNTVNEWVEGKKDCSKQLECYKRNMDCKWAKGAAHSEKDPLVDVTKNKTCLFPF